jgi:tetratricopeptide (TPR) repeat protein
MSRHLFMGLLLQLVVFFPATAGHLLAQTQPTEDPCADGKTLYEAAQFPQARNAMLRCVSLGNADLKTLLPLTVMGIREGRLEEAVKYGKMAIEFAPDDPDARYWYGRALLRQDRIEEARSQWTTGLGISLEHQGILEGLARLALNEGEPAKAYQLLDQMRRQGLDEAWVHRLLADIAAGSGVWDQSLVHLKDAMSRETPTLSDLLAASELSLMLNDVEGALGYCRDAKILEPGSASYGALGEAFFAADQLDSALVYLRMAVDMESSNSRHRFNLANALEIVGQYSEAETHFKYFLDAEPNDVIGHFNYAVHLDNQSREVEALFHLNRAIELEPGMTNARIVKVQLLEKMGLYEEALGEISNLEGADSANQNELDIWRNRLITARDNADGARREGKIHLQHMVLGDPSLVEEIISYLEAGADFGTLVIQYSTGPAAAKGGDIGWVDPEDMVEPMRGVIEALGNYDISPPIESRGLYHLFKRLP